MKQLYISFNQSIQNTRHILRQYNHSIITGVYQGNKEVTGVVDIIDSSMYNNLLYLARMYNQECILECNISILGNQFYNVLANNNNTLEILYNNNIDGYTITSNSIIAICNIQLANDKIKCNANLIYLK